MWRRVHFWLGAFVTLLGVLAWVASYAIVSYRELPPARDWTVTLWNGELWVTTAGTYYPPGLNAIHRWPRIESLTRTAWWPREGWFRSTNFGSGREWDFQIPIWAFVAFGAAVWGAAFPAWRRARRAAQAARSGVCRACRYDLTGIAGACPECGTLPM